MENERLFEEQKVEGIIRILLKMKDLMKVMISSEPNIVTNEDFLD